MALSAAMAAPASDIASGTTSTRDPWIKSVRANGEWQGAMATRLRVRSFELATDEPLSAGGTDNAPTPMEMVAAAVDGCITVVVATVAAELGIELAGVETTSAAHMDIRGFQGTADVTPHFVDYALTVRVTTQAPDDELTVLGAQVEKRCPALNLVRDAGVPLDLIWQFTNPE